MSARPTFAASLAALVLAAISPPAAAGLVDMFWGPAWLDASARSAYVHTPTGLDVVDQRTADTVYLRRGAAPGFPPGGVFATAAASSVQASDLDSGSNVAKDTADGRITVTYTVGTGGIDDRYAFEFSGMVSNENSFLSPGKVANLASVQLRGVIVLDINQNSADRTGFGFGDRVGSLTLQPLRAAQAYESFSLDVAVYRPNRSVLFTQAAGSAGGTIDLSFGERYELRLDYLMQVPAGIDPPISLQVGGSVSAVPEPASAALLAAGLVLLLRLPRRVA
jgi:hypothetical protein